MWSRCYRKHVIMAFPSFDTATNSWAPQADISWPTGPVRESEFVRFPLRFLSEGEAVACALSRGKSWIDRRLKHSNSPTALTVQNLASLQNRLIGKHPLARIQARRLNASNDSLSFDQFKAAFAKAGIAGSERLLRRSYDALIKLRRNANYSWAQIHLTVKRSQEIMTTLPVAARRRKKQSSLPLTQHDWRRIG